MVVAAEPSFAERLRAHIRAAGITTSELARRSGLTKQAVSLLVNAEREPSWDSVRKLARGLGVSVSAFDIGPTDSPADPVEDEPLPEPPTRPISKRK